MHTHTGTPSGNKFKLSCPGPSANGGSFLSSVRMQAVLQGYSSSELLHPRAAVGFASVPVKGSRHSVKVTKRKLWL